MARPPFHDQKTGVRYDCNNPDHLGWLRKESAWLKDWRPRFFVLKGSNLFFAKVKEVSRNKLQIVCESECDLLRDYTATRLRLFPSVI